jgi:glycosyltransferase involved in cell wall biosynthesis
MNNVGAVIICYNTPGIISSAVLSIVNFVDRLVIVDNSDRNNKAYEECETLLKKYSNIFVIHTEKNIGHGPALNTGIECLNTEYVICMDSDAVLLDRSLIDQMKEALEDPAVYGCGKAITTSSMINRSLTIPYLFLPFCMFKREVFNKHSKFINNGAPFKKTMTEIYKNMSIIDIKDFDKKLFHEGQATRRIAGDWRESFGGRRGI